jgi:hypothetical protein
MVTPVDIDKWPTSVVPQSERPFTKSGIIASGYTGTSYLDAVAAKWHITLPPRQESPAEPGDGPADRFTEGTVHPSAQTTLTLGGSWDLKGRLFGLECQASTNAPRLAEFLRDCVGADYPGARPAKAAAWVDGMRPKVDGAFRSVKGAVDSPLYRCGPAGSYMEETRVGRDGGNFYFVSTFGTGG